MLQAIEAGDFYASTGVELLDYQVSNTKMTVAVFAGGHVGHAMPVVNGDDVYAFTLGGN